MRVFGVILTKFNKFRLKLTPLIFKGIAMKNRILVGVGLLAAFIILAFLDIFWINFLLFALLLGLCVDESLKFYNLNNRALVVIALAFFTFLPFMNAFYVIFLQLAVVTGALAFVQHKEPKSILPFLYPAAPIFLMFGLLKDYGMSSLVWLVLCVAASDSAAFFVGKACKARGFIHPLCSSSPNKSIEGALAGIIAGALVGTLYAISFVDIGFLIALGASVLVAVFGIFGDLFESYLKRIAGLKDSGSLLASHGGLLDRVDGLLFGVIALIIVLA